MPEELTLSQDWLYGSIESSIEQLQQLRLIEESTQEEMQELLDQLATLIPAQFPRAYHEQDR